MSSHGSFNKRSGHKRSGSMDATSEAPPDHERTQAVFIRREDEVAAMAWDERVKNRIKHFFHSGHDKRGSIDQEDDDSDGESMFAGGGLDARPQPQYRLEATRRKAKRSLWKRALTCGIYDALAPSRGFAVGVHPNQKLTTYLHWMFRVNFAFLFAIMCVMFFAWVTLFSGFIAAAGAYDPECVRIGGLPFGNHSTPFADAFAVSWTTFSTVGYGSTYPALGKENTNWTHCFFISFVCSLESLFGVLYSGFCGAILFGKVLRIQSHAQVLFSDPIVIRYGTGVTDNAEFQVANLTSIGGDDEDGENNDDDDDEPSTPCPVLEFRIVNRLFAEEGGEIMDATLNVVANVDAIDADPADLSSRGCRPIVGFGSNEHSLSTESQMSDLSSIVPLHSAELARVISSGDADAIIESGGLTSLHKKILDRISLRMSSLGGAGGRIRRDHRAVDEDPSSRLLSKHIFSKMMIEAGDHPFFKRVWLARHVLDENSPVLKPRVRRQIRRNNGNWPDNLNTYEDIRDAMQFNQILVSLNGVSNVSANDVYAQKIYDFVDVNIGYQFVNILYKDTNGNLGVDTDLINDVREQNGGGGEPLTVDN